MDFETLQRQALVKIKVVEVKHGENARIGTADSRKQLQVDALKIFRQQPGSEPPGPLIEIAHNDSRPTEIFAVEYVLAEQAAGLMPALHESCAKMHIEHVKPATGFD